MLLDLRFQIEDTPSMQRQTLTLLSLFVVALLHNTVRAADGDTWSLYCNGGGTVPRDTSYTCFESDDGVAVVNSLENGVLDLNPANHRRKLVV